MISATALERRSRNDRPIPCECCRGNWALYRQRRCEACRDCGPTPCRRLMDPMARFDAAMADLADAGRRFRRVNYGGQAGA